MKKLNNSCPVFFLLIVFICVPLIAGSASEEKSKFILRVGGCLSFPNTGDINQMTRSYNQATSDLIALGQTSASDWKEINQAYEANFELIYDLSDKFKFGLEGGIIWKRFPGNWSYKYIYPEEIWGLTVIKSSIEENSSFHPSITAYPLLLNIYYYLKTGRLNVYLKAGAGEYFGRYKINQVSLIKRAQQDDRYDESGSLIETRISNQEDRSEISGLARSTAFGLQAGAGIDWKINGRISLTGEAIYRTVNFRKWMGEYDRISVIKYEAGILGYEIHIWQNENKYTFQSQLYTEYDQKTWNDEGENIYVRNIQFETNWVPFRPAHVMLDGLSLGLGVKIRL